MFRTLLVHHQRVHYLSYETVTKQYYTTINVLVDDGPVSSEISRGSVFLQMLLWIKWQLCVFFGWNCGNNYNARSVRCKIYCCLLPKVQSGSGAHPASTGGTFPWGSKGLGRETDHSLPPYAEVTNKWIIPPTPPYALTACTWTTVHAGS